MGTNIIEVPYPEDLKITETSPTLKELNQMVSDWLHNAELAGFIKTLFDAGKYLCVEGKPYKYSSRTPPKRVKLSDGVTLHYSEIGTVQNDYQVYHGSFRKIIVTIGGQEGFELIGGKQVAYIWEKPNKLNATKGGESIVNALIKKENFFLPGEWCNRITGCMPDIKTARQKAGFDIAKQKRNELIKRLSLGE